MRQLLKGGNGDESGVTEAFVHRSVFTLGDTNSFGNVYFARYFTLTGIVRELWCAARVANFEQHMASGLKLITSKAACEYIKDFLAFDPVRCEMTVPNLRHASADLLFRFFHEATEEKHAEATQTIVFADANHKICQIPSDFAQAARITVMGSSPYFPP